MAPAPTPSRAAPSAVPMANASSAATRVPSRWRTFWSSAAMRISSNTREPVVGAAAVGAEADADAEAPHLRDARDAVAEDHVGRRAVGKAGAPLGHQARPPGRRATRSARRSSAARGRRAGRGSEWASRRAPPSCAGPRTGPPPRGCESACPPSAATSYPARIIAGEAPCGLCGAGCTVIRGSFAWARDQLARHGARRRRGSRGSGRARRPSRTWCARGRVECPCRAPRG